MDLCREIAGRYSRRRLRSDPAARATPRSSLTVVKETRRLAFWAEETSTIASRRGASSDTVTEHLSYQINRATAETSLPTTQQTLDTPRASTGAAEADFSWKHLAPPDCDVNDSRTSAAPGSTAARMLMSPVFRTSTRHIILGKAGSTVIFLELIVMFVDTIPNQSKMYIQFHNLGVQSECTGTIISGICASIFDGL